LLLLASLEEKYIYRELNCFLGVENNILEGGYLADKATGNIFSLFCEAITLLVKEALSCFLE